MSPDPAAGLSRSVATTVQFEATHPVRLVLQLAAAVGRGGTIDETLTVTRNGEPLELLELSAPAGGRQHLADADGGVLLATYRADVISGTELPAVTPVEQVEALRPSRYCPSDRMAGFAATEFGGISDRADQVRAVCDWVFQRVVYTSGSSGPSTDALETLLTGQGVCRDYAHLVASLCRALDIPSRLVAVYAPGLSPMDLHAVVETDIDGVWRVWDATRLAPRQSLVRIATGRDAADTAFATTIGGATLGEFTVTATSVGDLPVDDHLGLVSLG